LTAQSDKNVGINTSTPDPSAVLDVFDPPKGVLFPRMTIVQINAIVLPTKGLLICQNDGLEGFYDTKMCGENDLRRRQSNFRKLKRHFHKLDKKCCEDVLHFCT